MQFANSQIIICLCNGDHLRSFGVVGQDAYWSENISKALNLEAEQTGLLMYLHTLPEYQNQGMAKSIIHYS